MINPISPQFDNTPISHLRPRFNYTPKNIKETEYITIVTPFYNTGEIFHQTVQSVLNQSFQQWKWLIVNDGSTDETAIQVLEEFRNHKDPRIKVVDMPSNQGPSAARNHGFALAQTKFIVPLDSDNLLEPTAIEKWWWFLESYPEYSFVKGYTVGFGAEEYLWSRGFHSGKAFLENNQVDTTSIIRKTAHNSIGGFNEETRGGLEDWEYWLKYAHAGYWGSTIPEYLDWYRRRDTHHDRWENWDHGGTKQSKFREGLKVQFQDLWKGEFPEIQPHWHQPNDTFTDELPCGNLLSKTKKRALLLTPWLTMGGSDKFTLDLVEQLANRDWEISIATTLNGNNNWASEFGKFTPDIFILSRFLHNIDYPKFLRYLIHSRQIDTVIITHSELGYMLLPYLKAHFPDVMFIDYCHIEEHSWKNGGYPRMAVDYQESLDLNIVSSHHLKNWMEERGGDSNRIEVCYTNIDPSKWTSDINKRKSVRSKYSIDNETPIILFAGRFHPQKQPRVLLNTLKNLSSNGLEFIAILAGDGAEKGWADEFVQSNNLQNQIKLIGAVPNNDIQDLMVASDIFFLPSLWEGIALSIFEAMACGLTVVGADVGGQKELVTPESGFLINSSNPTAETEAYTQILTDLLNEPAKIKQYGDLAQKRIRERFNLDNMGERFESLLELARDYSENMPRNPSSLSLGRIIANQTIEYIRVSQLADQLWAERNMHIPLEVEELQTPLWADHNATTWKERVYLRLYRWHEPYYYWYSQKGWSWLHPIREGIKKTFFNETQFR